jgi:hypothetical protein
MEQTLIALATKVADSLTHLSKSFVPLLDSKERENQKLKRLLRERTGIKDDDLLLREEIYPNQREVKLGAPVKRRKLAAEEEEMEAARMSPQASQSAVNRPSIANEPAESV